MLFILPEAFLSNIQVGLKGGTMNEILQLLFLYSIKMEAKM